MASPEFIEDVEQLRWSGPTVAFAAIAAKLDAAVTDGRGRGRR